MSIAIHQCEGGQDADGKRVIAVKKAELEAQYDAYRASGQRVDDLLGSRDVIGAIGEAIKAIDYAVGAIKFAKRDGADESLELFPCDVVCKYAPAVFEHESIERVHAFAKSTRQLGERRTAVIEQVEHAMQLEELALLMWRKLETHGTMPAAGVAEGSEMKFHSPEVLDVWIWLGIADVAASGGQKVVNLHTSLEAVVEGMCAHCGATCKAKKEIFWRLAKCPGCKTSVLFHLCPQHPRSA